MDKSTNRSEKFLTCHVNCQSLYAHFDEFQFFFGNAGYHAICMSETWLRSDMTDELVKLPGYTLFRCDREGRSGGGVAFYLSNLLQASVLVSSAGLPAHRPEFIIAEIIFKDAAKLLLAVVYRPPNIGYLDEFFHHFLEQQSNYRHSIIMGDFNADMLQATFDSLQLSSFVSSSSLFLVPSGPTHHLRNSSTLLDICIVDDVDKLSDHGQHPVPFLSAHDLIFIRYDLRVGRRRERTVICRDWRNLDRSVLLSEVNDLDWNDLFSSNNIDEKVDIFNSKLMELLNAHAPLVRRHFKNLPAPWLSDDIRSAMRERDLARRVWRRRRSDLNYESYRTLRNRVQSLIRSKKRAYYLSLFRDTDKMNVVWGTLRHLGLIKSKSAESCPSVTVEELNEFFTGVTAVSQDENASLGDFINGVFDDTGFHLRYTAQLSISRTISLAKSNAIGTDGVPLRFVKIILYSVAPVLEHLFNFSLMNGVFPTAWKSALICPIPKIKNPMTVQHYRPISILPCLSKVLERVVCEQICDYLEEADLFDPCQSAYRRLHSTQTCLIRMLDDARQAADRRMVTLSVFFDFSKAFDRVNHLTLMRKLKNLNFSNTALSWIYSYLSGRTQAVRDGTTGEVSSLSCVRAGVPQGSVLGPLLFTLYMSDFRDAIQHCKYNFYADDLQIYLHCEPYRLRESIIKINDDINNVVGWSTANYLLLNPDKTQAIIIGTSRYINSIDLQAIPRIRVGDAVIEYSKTIKYLGVVISNNFSWEKQVASTTKRVWSTLYQLKLCKHLLPAALRLRLITTLVLPHLDYCCAALTDLTKELNGKLTRALNACVRFVVSARRDEHITPYYGDLRLLSVEKRRNYFVGCLLYNVIHTTRPSSIYNNLTFRTLSAERNMRNSSIVFITPQCRTETFKRSFISYACRLWNNLPQCVRDAESSAVFKLKFYAFLINQI